MDYRPAVDLAIQRHQVLLAVEMAGRRLSNSWKIT
ncbi:hypothetical protein T03_15046 [Trichinella britovi]|uniref:Uncharacterized protein n=1 Tax=Trichinella britovi TaxID=45882 RepID=A0A0V1AHN6_TRIBR|nr:hypothetical protein T03_15046 [Trichinella britovi]